MNTFTTSLLAFLMLLTSCSYRQSARVGCHLDASGQACDTLFGRDDREVEAESRRALESLQSQIDGLVAANDILKEYLASTQSTLNIVQTMLDGLVTNEEYEALKLQVNALSLTIDSMQEQVNANTVQLAELELEDPIIEYIYPCGLWVDHFNEILMLTRSGAYVAYFESGANRFLTTLKDNTTYRLTDGSNCTFTIQNGQITNAHR
jgi:hypothetical protein